MAKKMRRMKHNRLAAVAALATMAAYPAYAQRASENAVNSAGDAFGVSIGSETVGIYSSSSARGFSPTQAGNIRIDGMYFDQQGPALGRVYADTTMRVGLSAQSYAFPAPTGIADTRLRRPADHLIGSAGVTYGPFDLFQVDLEASGPIVPGKLSAYATATSVFVGNVAWPGPSQQNTYGGVLEWTPNDTVNVAVFGQGQVSYAPNQNFIFTGGAFTPPEFDRNVYFGQPWAVHHRRGLHLGVVVSATLPDDWILRTGLFRSLHSLPDEYFPFFRNVQPDGMANVDILRSAPIHDLSYSGEARLSRTFTEGPRQHTLQFAVRGRDAAHEFGGGSSVSFGTGRIGVYDPRPEPVFPTPVPPSHNHVSQVTPGIAYVGRWRDLGEFSVGAQKSIFRGEVAAPGVAPSQTSSNPWLYNGTLAIYLSNDAALYGSYTRGLEESGVASESASNRGESLPVSLTEQIDAGIRYKIGSRVTLIAGVFEVKKPFFDRNAANLFTQVGNLSHRGIELSMSGRIAPGLTIVAGAMLLRPRIEANAAVASFIGPVPAGKPNRNVRLNVQYAPASWHGFSIDGQVNQDGPAFANRANTFQLDPNTTLDLGARYVFKAFGTSASARLRLLNVTDAYGWTVSASSSYSAILPRRVTAQLVADF